MGKIFIAHGLFTRFLLIHLGVISLLGLMHRSACDDGDLLQMTEIPTVTVRGFLNFRTTVDGTVIVFTPASELPKLIPNTKNSLKPSDDQPSRNAIDNDVLTSKETVPLDIQDITYTKPPSLPNRIHPVSELVTLGRPKIKDDYPHLPLSDNAVLPSAVHTDNDLESGLNKKIPPSQNRYPTGLVTVLNGMNVESGKTTMYETKVVGTYIDGKYAQILQSSSKIVPVDSPFTPSYRTIGQALSTNLPLSNVPNSVPFSTKVSDPSVKATATLLHATVKSIMPDTLSGNNKMDGQQQSSSIKFPIELQSSLQTPYFTSKVDSEKPTQSLDIAETRMPIKMQSSHPPISSTHIRNIDDEDTLLSNKNLRLSSSRIRFTALRRPSQKVRLNRFKVRLTLRQNATDGDLITPTDDDEQDDEHEHSIAELTAHADQDESVELDIDPAQVVYRETTITSKVTLHVGRRKSIRTLTITTSVPMRINPTDAHDLAGITHSVNDPDTDSNSPISHSVVTRTFTTTERTETTTVVPVFDGTTTTDHVLRESFFIMKIVTVYRTLPPGDFTVVAFDNEPTEVQEIMATTLDVAANVQPTATELSESSDIVSTSEPHIQSSLTNSDINQSMNTGMTDPILSFGQALSHNPLAAVYLGLQQLNAQMTLYSTITQVSTFLTTDTIYSTKTIRFYDGRSTRFRTTSDPISTKKRTATTTITSLQPYINTQAYQQQQHLQKLIAATRMGVPQPQYSTMTSIYATSTTATSLSTRIYTLIYNGFSTKFRTVTSTKTYPTILTITSTKEVPIAATHPPLLSFAYPYPAA